MGRPRSEDSRVLKLVVRVSVGEKARLEALAGAAGRNVSEFVRSAALAAGGGPPATSGPVGRVVAVDEVAASGVRELVREAERLEPSRADGSGSQVVRVAPWLAGRSRMPVATCRRLMSAGRVSLNGGELRDEKVELAVLEGGVVRVDGRPV